MMFGLLSAAAMATTLSLSYEEALTRAGERNQTVLGAQQDVVVAEASLLAARAPFEPLLDASGGFANNRDKGYSNQFGSEFESLGTGWNARVGIAQSLASGTTAGLDFSLNEGSGSYRLLAFDTEFEQDPSFDSRIEFRLSQAVLQGNRLAYNLQAVRTASRARSMSEADAVRVRQEALASAARAYWELHYARQLVTIARRTLETQQEQQRVVQALVEGGKLAAVESTRIEAAVAQADRALLDAENAAAGAEDTLLIVLGEEPGTPVELRSAPVAPPAIDLDEARVVEAVVAGNPELRSARIAADGAAVAVDDARHQMLPELGVNASAAITGFGYSFSDATSSLGSGYRELNVGASLSVPLLNRADRANLDQRKAEALKARLSVEGVEASLAQQARAQVRTLEAARRTVELTRLNVRLGEETLAVERARLEEGRTLQKDVIEAVKDLDAARVDAEKALIDYQLAVVELERLKGGL